MGYGEAEDPLEDNIRAIQQHEAGLGADSFPEDQGTDLFFSFMIEENFLQTDRGIKFVEDLKSSISGKNRNTGTKNSSILSHHPAGLPQADIFSHTSEAQSDSCCPIVSNKIPEPFYVLNEEKIQKS